MLISHPVKVDLDIGSLLGKFVYWASQAQLFATQPKVIQTIMIPMVSSFLSLLTWTKKSNVHLAHLSKYKFEERIKNQHELAFIEQYLIPMVSYFFHNLLTWTKKSNVHLDRILKYKFEVRESRINMSWVSYNNICTPKHLGGASLPNMEDHMVAQTSSLLKGVYRSSSLIGDHLFFLWKMLVYAMGK